MNRLIHPRYTLVLGLLRKRREAHPKSGRRRRLLPERSYLIWYLFYVQCCHLILQRPLQSSMMGLNNFGWNPGGSLLMVTRTIQRPLPVCDGFNASEHLLKIKSVAERLGSQFGVRKWLQRLMGLQHLPTWSQAPHPIWKGSRKGWNLIYINEIDWRWLK